MPTRHESQHDSTKRDEYLNKRLEEKNNLIKHLYEISCLLTGSPDLDEVLDEILFRVMTGLHFNRASIFLLNHNETRLDCHRLRGHDYSPEQEMFVYQNPIMLDRHDCYEKQVIVKGEPLFIKNVSNHVSATHIDKIINRNMERKSVLYVPLKFEGKVLGMIGVDRYKMQFEITKYDIESLTLFANQASIIISNARYLKALNDQKKLSENIIRSSINGTIVSDLEGHIRIINPMAKEIFGLSNDAAKHILLQDIIKINNDKWIELIKELSNNKPIPAFELLVDKHDRKRLLLDITIFAVFSENDEIENLVTNIVDVTEKKKLEEYWLRLEKFAALNVVASGIAHEIRNPLAAIYTALQNLGKEYTEDSSQYAIILSVLNEIDGTERLIRQLLNLSKPSPLLMIDAEICEVLLFTVKLVWQKASARNISIRTNFKNKKFKTRIDPERMKQVFLNLIINAIDAIENKGQILISARKEKSEKAGHNWIVIEIKDNGIGIPKSDISKIFDPFFTTKTVGTGLGLSVSHKIVQEHCGRIEVESIEHKGTTFYIKLPMNK